MSQTIDSKVVEMQFDNRQFEQNVNTTLLTLANLKSALKLDKAADGFSNITKAAKNVSLGGLTAGVSTVTHSFSALEIAGVTAMVRITNAVINLGKRMVNDLAIAPVMQGFNEYELKMGSVQTIMASTGESIKTVSAYLEELNKYADRTIYSFSDMTNNIGKFTNAGVKLDSAVAAIKGISNEAAISGANAAEASRAMYNFAQALSAGYVKLIDWKSIENANMATKDFKQQLIETAVAMGTVVKAGNDYNTVTTNNNGKIMEGFNATKNFNDSLSAQWMTTEVLVQTLNNYATDVRDMTDSEVKAYEQKLKAVGYTEKQIAAIEELGKKAFDAAQDVKTFTQLMDTLKEAAGSGWAQTFEIIFGDLEEAKKLWTGVSQAVGGFIDKTSEARNNLLRGALRDIVDPKKLTDIGPDKLGIGEKEWLALKKIIKDTAKEQGIAIDRMIDANGSFENSLKQGWLTSDLLAKSLDKVNKLTTKKTVEQITSVRDAALKVINGDYGNGVERINRLTAAGLDAKKVQKYVDLIYDLTDGTWNYSKSVLDAADKQMDLKVTVDEVSDAELKSLGYTDEEIKALRELAKSAEKAGTPLNELVNTMESGTGRDLLIESFGNLYKTFADIAGAVTKGLNDVFSPINARQLYDYIKRFNELTKKLQLNTRSLVKIRVLSRGIFSALSVGRKILTSLSSKILPVVLNALERLGTILFDNALRVASYFTKLNAVIDESETLTKVSEALAKILDSLFKIALNVLENALPLVLSIANLVSKTVLAPAWNLFVRVLTKISGWIERISDVTTPLWEKIDRIFKRITNFVKSAKVEQALLNIWNVISRVGSSILTLVGNLFSHINFEEILSSLIDFSTFVGSNIVDAFEKASDSISYFIDNIQNMSFRDISLNVQSIFASAIEYITSGQLTKDLFGAFPSLEKTINDFLQKIAGIANGLGAGLDTASVNIGNFGKTVKAVFEKIDWGSVFSIITAAISIFGLKSIYNIIYSLQVFAAGFRDFGEVLRTTVSKINGVFTSIKKFFDAARWSLLGAVFIEFAIGVGILALALIKLGQLPKEQLQQGLEVIALLSMGMVSMFGVIKQLSLAPGDVTGTGILMIAIAGAVYILAQTLKDIVDIKFENGAIKSLMVLGGMVLAMAFVYKIISGSKLQKGVDIKAAIVNAFSILILAVALKIVVWSLNDIAKMDLDHPFKTLFTLIAIMGLMALLCKAMEGVSLKTGIGVLGLVIGIKLFIGIIQDVANNRTLLKDTLKAMPTLITIAVLMGVLMLATRLAGQHALKAGAAIVLIAVALNLMIIAISALATIAALNPSALKQAVKSLFELMLAVGVLIASTKFAGEHSLKAGVMMLAVAGALALIAISMGILATIPIPKLAVVAIIVDSLILLFSGLVYVSQFVGPATGTIITIAAIVGVMALVLIGLYQLKDTEKLIKVAAAWAILIVALGVVFYAASKLKGVTGWAIGAIVAMGVAVVAIGVLLYYMANNIKDADAALKSSESIAIVLLSMSVALGILAALKVGPKDAAKAGFAFDLFMAIVGGLAAIIHVVTDILGFDLKGWIDEAIPVIEGIGKMFGAFGKGIAEMANIKSSNGAEKEAVPLIDKFIDTANKLSGVTEESVAGAKRLGEILTTIGMANFGASIGNLFSGGAADAVDKFTTFMPQLATGIVRYAHALDEAGIDDKLLDNSTAALNMLSQIANADVGHSSGLITFFAGNTSTDIEAFSRNMPKLATALGQFCARLGLYKSQGVDMSEKTVKEASGLLSMLGQMASNDVGNSSGLISKIAGFNGTDIEEFSRNMPKLATALGQFCSRLTLYSALKDETVIQMAKDSVKMLSELGKMSTGLGHSSSSIITDFAGYTSTDMENFGRALPQLATALGQYCERLKLYPSLTKGDAAQKVKDTIGMLSDLGALATSGIGSSAGIIDFIGGRTSDDMKRFANNLPELASGLVGYATTLGDFNSTNVATSIAYLYRLGELFAYLKERGVFDDVVDKFYEFGANLDALAASLANFSMKVEGVDLSLITGIKDFIEQIRLIMLSAKWADPSAVDKVQETLDRLAELSIDGLVEKLRGGKQMVEAAALDLTSTLTNAFSKAPDLTESIDKFINGVKQQLESRSDSFNAIGKEMASKLGSGLSSGLKSSSPASDAGAAAAKAVAAAAQTVGQYSDAGSNAMSSFADGISKNSDKVKAAARKAAEDSIKAIRGSVHSGFRSAGVFAVMGFASGISSNTFIATAKAREMANKAKEAARRALDEHSPSKEFYKIGDFAVQGFANAFSDGTDLSYDSGFMLANKARIGLGNALTKISDLIDNGIDTQPTIRPILDLSDIENGATAIGGMLNLDPSVGVSNNLGAIGGYMMFRNQNATNDDVVAAINSLRSKIGEVGGTTTVIDGITYDDGSNINEAVGALIRAAKVERRA